LTEDHKRVLESGLAIVEQCLERIGQLARTERTYRPVFLGYNDELEASEAELVASLVREMREEMAALKERCGLTARVLSRRRELDAQTSLIWTVLEDLKPEKMGKSYGAFMPDEERLIRPHVMKLLKMNSHLRSAILGRI